MGHSRNGEVWKRKGSVGVEPGHDGLWMEFGLLPELC